MNKYFYFLFLLIAGSCSNPEKKDPKMLDYARTELNLPKGSTEKEIKMEIDKQLRGRVMDIDVAKTIKIKELSRKLGYKKGLANANSKLIPYYTNNTEYQKALALANETEMIAKELKNVELLASNFIDRSRVYSRLNFEDDRLKDIKLSLQYGKQISNNDHRHYQIYSSYHAFVIYYERKRMPDSIFYYMNKELPELQSMNDSRVDDTYSLKHSAMLMTYIDLGSYYTGLRTQPRLDLAEPFFEKALAYKEKDPEIFERYNRESLISAGRFYVEKGEYQKAIDLSREALKIEKSKRSMEHRMLAFMNLANSFEELKIGDSTAKYTIQFSRLNDSVTHMQARQAAKHIKQAVSNKSREKDVERTSSITGLLWSFTGIITLLGLLVWYFWKRDQKIKYAKFEKIINQLKNKEEDIRDQDPTENSISDTVKTESNLNIHHETVGAILQKLKRFEASTKFLRQDVTLTSLSNSFDTNPRYLSEVVKQYKEKNFNSYLNGLRIQHIIEQLYKEPLFREYKITYLAGYSGFASREVFANAFKKETGVTPSYFINQLRNG